MNKDMLLVVTANCCDEFYTRLTLESPEPYNLDIEDEKVQDIIQNVVDSFENDGVTIDQGGDDHTLEFDLPDAFDNAGKAQKAATKLLKKLRTKLKKYVVTTNSVPVISDVEDNKQCCCIHDKS